MNMDQGIADPQPEQQGLDFSTVIASTVHDMKNSLALLLQNYSQWLDELPAELANTPQRGIIEYEAMRLNGMLVQMLGLYKLGVNQLPVRPMYHDVEDFLEQQVARHADILASRGIECRVEVDEPGLEGFFDAELVGSVVANVINNSIRYSRSAIVLEAREEDQQLVITVSDDGAGYPAAMLENQSDYILGINMSSGSTGLGLYFGERIASLHQRDGRCGHIRLANGGSLGGGEFSIWLP